MRSKLVRKLSIAAVVAGMFLAGGKATLFVMASGGLQGALLNLKHVPDPNGAEIQELLRLAEEKSDRAIVQAEQSLDLGA